MEIDMKDYNFPSIWALAQRALQRVNQYKYCPETDTYEYGPHRWWLSISNDFQLHPVIAHIVLREAVRPVDWQLLMLEWPHVSIEDDSQIAYTRNERAGEDYLENGSARQTRTSIGKYLSRHWPHVPDHIRRDWAGRHSSSKFAIWDTMEGIISSVELGPCSCMKSSYGSIPFRNLDNETLVAYHAGQADARTVKWHYHPYFVYNPERGWASAVRIDSGQPTIVLGRALIHKQHKCFVRSYARGETEASTSYTDERLDAWLREQGYEKRNSWPHGVTFDQVDHPTAGGTMMPYIDGGERRVSIDGDHMVLDGDGPECDNTNGTYDNREVYGECEDCCSTVYDDDDNRIWVGSNDNRLVGGDCGCCNNYRYVEGARGNYYAHEDDAVRVRGDWYDRENLPDCIKELADGDYEHEDYCQYVENQDAYYANSEVVHCETDGEYYVEDDDEIVTIDGAHYRKDDDDVVECEDGDYRMKDDCWEDAETGNWYSNDESPIILNSDNYHPDTLKNALSEAGEL